MEHRLMKYSTQNKLGRNSICQCGSGKKYKKCCMNDETILNNSKTLIQTSMGAIKQRNPEHAALFFDSEEMGVIKMSEVILEYADELLELATTDKGKENALLFAITAWNISLADEDKRSEMINSFIVDIWNVRKGSTQWKDMYEIFKKLIDIKLYDYPSLNRFIFDYELIKLNETDFHLNVISSLDYTEMET